MILPDLNLLLYAYNPYAPQHPRAAAWWESCLQGDELIGLPNEICLGFVRIATHPRLGKASVELSKARQTVDHWLELPQTRILLPAPTHFSMVMNLMESATASGGLVSDATLAAYAIHHRATLYSNDTDFARFKDLDWNNPLLEK